MNTAELVERVTKAFFAQLAEDAPAAAGGDVEPVALARFEDAAYEVAREWLILNEPANETHRRWLLDHAAGAQR